MKLLPDIMCPHCGKEVIPFRKRFSSSIHYPVICPYCRGMSAPDPRTPENLCWIFSLPLFFVLAYFGYLSGPLFFLFAFVWLVLSFLVRARMPLRAIGSLESWAEEKKTSWIVLILFVLILFAVLWFVSRF